MEEIKLKSEFEDKLKELGVYDKWVVNWKNDDTRNSIEYLNSQPSFEDFIYSSFSFNNTPKDEGFIFWDEIAES